MKSHSKLQEVNSLVDIVEVAKYYGIELNRANKSVCPFHSEKTASLSFSQNKQVFRCFGCGIGGNSITLVSKLLNVNAYEAAKIINRDFSCGVEFDKPVSKYTVNLYKQKQDLTKQFNDWINGAYITLCKYYRELSNNKWMYAPKITDEDFHPKYVEALQNINKIEYYIDYLFSATEDEKIKFWKQNKQVVSEIEKIRTSRQLNQ